MSPHRSRLADVADRLPNVAEYMPDVTEYVPDAERTATGLGWFSIALGAAELFAPHALAGALGMRGSETLIRTYGAREILSGIGILTSRDPAPWLWGRVAGDALDMATLATRLGEDNEHRRTAAFALAAVAGVAALDLYAAGALSGDGHGSYGRDDFDDRREWDRLDDDWGRGHVRGEEVWEEAEI